MPWFLPLILSMVWASAQNTQTNAFFNLAHTAQQAQYLSSEEKNIILYINLARTQPQWFVQRYFNTEQVDTLQSYVSSLRLQLNHMSPKPLVYPDKKLFKIARGWAREAGKKNHTGHLGFSGRARRYSKSKPMAECCSYGYSTGLEIVLQLLIDDQVPQLGHRKALLSDFTLVGPSIQPHRGYDFNAVLDFSIK